MSELGSDATRNQYRSHYLWLEEERLRVDGLSGSYDLFLSLASWETRATAISTLSKLSADQGIIVHFQPSHAPPDVLSASIDALRNGLLSRTNSLAIEPLSRSTSFLVSLQKLRGVVEARRAGRRNLKVGIDISSVPIGYVQGLVSWLLSEKVTASVDCFYVEPTYSRSITSPSDQFTAGTWQLSAVPYLEGAPSGSLDKSILVCIGAETTNTRELLLGREYTSAAIVKPDSSPALEWGDQLNRDCEELVGVLNIVGEACKICNPFSVNAVVRYYEREILPHWRTEQRLFVAIGPKPHGLAGAICGIADPGLSVFARVPSGYVVRDVSAGEYCWRYRIRDLSSPDWAATPSAIDWT